MSRLKEVFHKYLNEYPILKFIVPSIIHQGNNISPYVLISIQVFWILAQILRADEADVILIDSNNKPAPANVLNKLNLTANDVKLLAVFVALASGLTVDILSDVTSGTSISYDSGSGYGIVTNYGTNDGHTRSSNRSNMKTGNISSATAKEIFDLLNSDQIGFDKNLFRGDSTDDYSKLLKSLISNNHILTEKKVNALLGLIPFALSVPANQNFTSRNPTVSKLLSVPFDFKNEQIDPKLLSANRINLKDLIDVGLFQLNIVPLSNSNPVLISLLCSEAANSFHNAMNPVAKLHTDSFRFERDDEGRQLLVTVKADGTVIEQDYTKGINKLVGANSNFCRVFGSSTTLSKKTDTILSKTTDTTGISGDNCSLLYNYCLGSNTSDVNQCRVHFNNLKSITKHYRGWSGLHKDEKKYLSYLILTGLGLIGDIVEDGHITYINYNKSGPIYSNEELIIKLGLTNTHGASINDKLQYLLTLMMNVDKIDLKKSNDINTRIRFGNVLPATKNPGLIQTITISDRPSFVPFNFGSNMQMIGGYSNNDIKIINPGNHTSDITTKLDILSMLVDESNKKNQLTQSQIQKINKLYMELTQNSAELDAIEQSLHANMYAKSLYPNINSPFTEAEIAKINESLLERQQKYMKNFNKANLVEFKLNQSLSR